MTRLKALLVPNIDREVTTIEDMLDSGLPRAYTPELYREKCSTVFEHVYESYPERDAGVYS